jgi:hypothetical protein
VRWQARKPGRFSSRLPEGNARDYYIASYMHHNTVIELRIFAYNSWYAMDRIFKQVTRFHDGPSNDKAKPL